MNMYEIVLEDCREKEVKQERHYVTAYKFEDVFNEFNSFSNSYEYEIVSITRHVPISRSIPVNMRTEDEI